MIELYEIRLNLALAFLLVYFGPKFNFELEPRLGPTSNLLVVHKGYAILKWEFVLVNGKKKELKIRIYQDTGDVFKYCSIIFGPGGRL